MTPIQKCHVCFASTFIVGIRASLYAEWDLEKSCVCVCGGRGCSAISSKQGRPKFEAAKSYSKLVTANRMTEKRDTGSEHAGDEEEEEGGFIIRIHLLLS